MIAFVALGANLGSRDEILARFRSALSRIAGLPYVRAVDVSRVYRSAPVGPVREQPAFLNAVARVDVSAGGPEQLLADLLAIEDALGRVRAVPGGPRVIDLDLLCMGAERRDTPDLALPHPRMAERAFVLLPLGDLVGPDWVLPATGEDLRTASDRVLLAPEQSCDVAAVLDDDHDQAGQGEGEHGV